MRVFPRGATPIDFAYAIHSEVGDHCSGARVNGAIVPLRYKLRNGDVVEMMTHPQQHPTKDWLDFVVTSRARTKVRAYLRTEAARQVAEARARAAREGAAHARDLAFEVPQVPRRGCAECSKPARSPATTSSSSTSATARSPQTSVADLLAPPDGEAPSVPPRGSAGGQASSRSSARSQAGHASGIRLNGIDDVLVRYAKCCNPLPGDEIIGFITRGRGVTVHRRNCPKAFDTDPERRVEISWDAQGEDQPPRVSFGS